jgi:hypothetical protein
MSAEDRSPGQMICASSGTAQASTMAVPAPRTTAALWDTVDYAESSRILSRSTPCSAKPLTATRSP